LLRAIVLEAIFCLSAALMTPDVAVGYVAGGAIIRESPPGNPLRGH
jgi:hypothetical protein